MYHIADCVAAGVTSKNEKGCLCQALTDIVFINGLPAFLHIAIKFHTFPSLTLWN